MEPRMTHPVMIVPDALKALHALDKSVHETGLSTGIIDMVNLRVSQINGCSVCVEMHAHDMRKAGESDERIFGVAAWRDTPYFSEAERAALALAEALTRLNDRPDAVTDAIWDGAADNFSEPALAGLLLSIAEINVWNRLNAATRQVAGAW